MLCAVVFTKNGQLFYANPGGLQPAVGDKVLYPTEHGAVVATVLWPSEYTAEDTDGFPTLQGRATSADEQTAELARTAKARAIIAARKLARAHGLPMKVLAADPQASRTVIYYSSPETVDFRSLLRDLSSTLHTRVELRQVTDRDAVRVTGAIGSCGRDTCCSTFLRDYDAVTLAMARDQDLPLNPMRISGACGRLMCCLKYEHPLYAEFKATAPSVGSAVESPHGPGTVVGHNALEDSVVVKLAADGSREICSRASVCSARKAYDSRAH